MRRLLVSSFLADVIQHIHSLRARGVMLAQTSVTVASDAMALRRSAGILCAVPEAIDCRAMIPGVYSGHHRQSERKKRPGLHTSLCVAAQRNPGAPLQEH